MKVSKEKVTVTLLSHFLQKSLSQFTVLYEDALCELLSFFEDLLIIDIGHGGN